jgi:hypothetical protein
MMIGLRIFAPRAALLFTPPELACVNAEAVVDPALRVRGLEGLWVIEEPVRSVAAFPISI